jgi:hypothetical protein
MYINGGDGYHGSFAACESRGILRTTFWVLNTVPPSPLLIRALTSGLSCSLVWDIRISSSRYFAFQTVHMLIGLGLCWMLLHWHLPVHLQSLPLPNLGISAVAAPHFGNYF